MKEGHFDSRSKNLRKKRKQCKKRQREIHVKEYKAWKKERERDNMRIRDKETKLEKIKLSGG